MRVGCVAAHEAWAEQFGRTYGGVRAIPATSPGLVDRAIDTAARGWRKVAASP